MRISALIFWILLLAVLAGLGYLAWTEYTDLPEIETGLDELEAPPRSNRPPNRPTLTDKLAEAIAAEKDGKWEKAEKLYQALAETEKADLVKSKLTALTDIRLAKEAEKQGKTQDALFLYRKAKPALTDPSILNKPIERLELTLEYQALYERGLAAEKAGKWEEAANQLQKAREIAPRAGISTIDLMKKIRANRERVAKLREELDGYYWLLAAFAALDDPYATIAVCDYYLSRDLFLGLRGDLETRRANAVQTILKRRAQFPRPSAGEEDKVVRAQLKNGQTIEGILVSEDKMGIVVRETKKAEYRNRLIARAVLEKLERADHAAVQKINDKTAEQLLQLIAKRCEERPAEVLGLLGKLFHEFPTAAILKDVPEQRRLIVTASVKTGRKCGDSIPKLLASNITFFQKICPVCGGTGHPICPACKGTGMMYQKCDHCKGDGACYCGTCGGASTITSAVGQGQGESADGPPPPGKRCPTCRGTGTRTCGQCGGDGGFHTVCTKCRGGRRPTCPACRGTGQRPRGKFGPEDVERLKKVLNPK